MGRDKALLPYRGATLAGHVAAAVKQAAGGVVLVGDPARYGGLGYRAIPDAMQDSGPLAGIHAALLDSSADWNLLVACDMPGVSAALLESLLEAAERAGADAFLPAGPSGHPEPLCAVYHRRCRDAIGAALAAGVRKVRDGLAGLDVAVRQWDDAFQNCNTPGDWAAYSKTPPGGD